MYTYACIIKLYIIFICIYRVAHEMFVLYMTFIFNKIGVELITKV